MSAAPPGFAVLPPPASRQQQAAAVAEQEPSPSLLPPPPPCAVVVQGTCGWSDTSLVRCGRFYPSGVRTSEDKLRHYSKHFGCVEVDTSTYAIPRADVTKRWAQAAVPGFKFHVKAFGLFCSQSCQSSSLPAEARALLPPGQQQQQQQHVRLGSMPGAVEDACWRLFHGALEPLYQAGKLGAVVFQFHLTFVPSQQNLQYILRCRRLLDARFGMAAEVRCRRWFTDPAWRQQLCDALLAQGIALVSADELEHETAQRDREQSGLPTGGVRQVLPISLEVTTPDYHYVRVHRRHGTTDRLLPAVEIEGWAERLAQQLAPRLRGPLFFLWGTDWEDAPMRNARNLEQALPAALRFDWRQHCRSMGPSAGSIQSFFAQRPPVQAAAEVPASAPAAPGSGTGDAGGSSSSSSGGTTAGQQQQQQWQQQQQDPSCEPPGSTAEPPPGAPPTYPLAAAAAAAGRKRARDGTAVVPVAGSSSGSGRSSSSILRYLKRQSTAD